MRAALYARVSTEEQAERQKSIPQQLEACRAYCKERGWQVVAEHTDPGISGTLEERPGLGELMRDVEARRVGRVVVWTFSRLARSSRLFHHLGWQLEKAGAQIVAVDQDSASELERDIHAAIDAEYVRRIKRDVTRAMRAKAVRGERTGSGNLFGYRWTSKTEREIVPSEAAQVRHAFGLYDAGHSLKDVAAALGWNRYRLRNMLIHPAYAGRYVYGRRKWRAGKCIWQPESSWTVIEDAHPAIVSADQWERVNARLHRNSAIFQNGHQGRLALPLSNLLRCEKCGESLRVLSVYPSPRGRLRYYGCRNERHENGPPTCPGVGHPRDDLWLPAVLARVLEEFTSPAAIKAIVAEIERLQRADDGSERKRLSAQIRHLERQAERLSDAIASDVVSDVSRLAKRLECTQNALATTKQHAAGLGRAKRELSPRSVEERISAMAADLSNLQTSCHESRARLARQLLAQFVDHITVESVTGGKIHMQWDAILGLSVARIPGMRLPHNCGPISLSVPVR